MQGPAESWPKSSDPIVRQKLSDQVLDRLREMIVRGELAQGDRLPSERELMQHFGVGRPAVREALQALHTQGLITISHGERSTVNELSAEVILRQADTMARLFFSAAPESLEHLKEARRLFEIGMVRIAATNATSDAVAELRRLIALQSQALNNAADFIRCDMDFHRQIAAMSGNPILRAVSASMLNWLFQFHASLLHWSGREDVTLSDHARIVDGIEKNDPEAAAVAMESHLDRSSELYRHRA